MGDYYINIYTGTIQQQHNSLLGQAMAAAGFVGPFDTIQKAKDFYNKHGKKIGAQVATGGASSATGGLPNPLNVFHGLDLGNLLLRIGEVVLGVVLVGVGIAKLTGTTNFVSSVVKAKIP